MRSESTPPNTIAPSRPLPMGSASFHIFAGWRYHKTFAPEAIQHKQKKHDARIDAHYRPRMHTNEHESKLLFVFIRVYSWREVLARRREIALQRVFDQSRNVVNVELAHQARAIRINGLRAKRESRGDLFRAHTFAQQR